MIFSSGFGIGFLTGFGAGLIAREVLAWSADAARPVAKAAIGSTLSVIDKGKHAAYRVGESFEDLVAEARAEYNTSPEKSRKTPAKKATTKSRAATAT